MKYITKALIASFAGLSACTLPPTQSDVQPNAPGGWEAGISQSSGQLYGRDGAPVGSSQIDPVTVTNDSLNHAPDSAGGSRPVLLELYQEAVNDREYLEMELAMFNEEREGFQNEEKRASAQIQDLQTRVEGLEAENRVLEKQTFELGERLATAQLRRLEAEKALLEQSIAARKAAEASAAEEVE